MSDLTNVICGRGHAFATILAATVALAGAVGPVKREVTSPDAGMVPQPAAESSPMAELRRSDADLRLVLGRRIPGRSPEYEAQQIEIHRLTAGLLDFEEFSGRALAPHWSRLTPAQKNRFVSLLRTLIEKSYVPQINGDPRFRVTFEREEKTGTSARVFGVVTYEGRGIPTSYKVEYRLLYKGDHWAVYDIVTDGESLLENYRAQFDRVIRKRSFDGLLETMRRRAQCCGD
jgi:phospholipid transport system substrate-binding protein